MIKRWIAACMTILAVVLCIPVQNANALVFTPNCQVASEAAVLLNMDTGTIVYEKNADMKEMPAALTQIMTAVVVLETCQSISNERVTAKQVWFDAFADYEYQTDLRYANINAGDTLTVEDLLYAMLLTSSCEAAIMLANHFGNESEDAFVDLMNDKAAELGMTATRFTNATGLYSARQQTSAGDMMTLLQYAMKVPRFEAIACADSYTPSAAKTAGKEEQWAWEHSNIMMDKKSDYYCAGVRGIKTANLQAAGRSIACKASRDGNNYLLVCMNSPMYDETGANHFYHCEDAKNIIEWAFSHLSYQEVLKENVEIDEVSVANAKGNDYVIVVPNAGYSCIWSSTADINTIQQTIQLEQDIKAPVEKGQKLGTLTLKLSGETLAEIDLVAASSVERSFWKYNLSIIPGFFCSEEWKAVGISGFCCSALYIGLCIFFYARYRAERKKRPQPQKK